MKLTDITPAIALTPLDGRYHKQTAPLVEYLSEPALNRERMRVEVEWMILLANGFEGNGNQPIVEGVEPFTDAEIAFLRHPRGLRRRRHQAACRARGRHPP